MNLRETIGVSRVRSPPPIIYDRPKPQTVRPFQIIENRQPTVINNNTHRTSNIIANRNINSNTNIRPVVTSPSPNTHLSPVQQQPITLQSQPSTQPNLLISPVKRV